MRRNPKALRNTAFHESGHAVVAWALDAQFKSVSIKPDQERRSLGCVMLQKQPKWAVPDAEEYNKVRARAWFEKMAEISLAGQAAEAKHAGGRPTRYSHSNDNEQVFDMALEICSSREESEAWAKLIFIRARNRLDHFWPAVEALAEVLLKRDTITFAEAQQIIHDAMRPPGRLPKIETVPSIRRLS